VQLHLEIAQTQLKSTPTTRHAACAAAPRSTVSNIGYYLCVLCTYYFYMQLVQLHLEVWHTHHLKCNPTTRYTAAEGKYIYIHLTALCSCTKKYGTQLSLPLLYAACAAAPRNGTNPTQKYPYYSICSLCSCTKKYGTQYCAYYLCVLCTYYFYMQLVQLHQEIQCSHIFPKIK
jgi:hypothetical protein